MVDAGLPLHLERLLERSPRLPVPRLLRIRLAELVEAIAQASVIDAPGLVPGLCRLHRLDEAPARVRDMACQEIPDTDVAMDVPRRGVAEGARWEIFGVERPTLFRRATSSGMLLVRAVQPPERFAWTLTGDHIDAELRLEESESNRTLATLEVEAPWLYGFSRALQRRALARLHALYQTAADI